MDRPWIKFYVRLPESIGGERFVSTAFWPDGVFVHQPRLHDARVSGTNVKKAAELRALLDAPDALQGASSGTPYYEPTYTIVVRNGEAVREARYCYEIEMGTACGASRTDGRILSLLLWPR